MARFLEPLPETVTVVRLRGDRLADLMWNTIEGKWSVDVKLDRRALDTGNIAFESYTIDGGVRKEAWAARGADLMAIVCPIIANGGYARADTLGTRQVDHAAPWLLFLLRRHVWGNHQDRLATGQRTTANRRGIAEWATTFNLNPIRLIEDLADLVLLKAWLPPLTEST